MPAAVPLKIGHAEPKDAVAAYQSRSLLLPSYRWQDVYQAEHAAGVAVAGISQLDVLGLFADELGKSLKAGTSLADFQKALRPALQAKGFWGDVEVAHPTTGDVRTTRFDDARLKLIYDVNLRQSYAAGTWARAERTQATKPLLSYRTMRDERVRISHRPWDGVALPIGHPWWATHYPPNGWRCRCTAFAVSEQDLARLQAAGVPVKRDAPEVVTTPFVNRSTGEISQVPVGIDPGFAYNPGQVRQQQVALLQRQALDSAPPELARAVTQQAVQGPAFGQFVADPAVPHQVMPVGMLNPQAAQALQGNSRTVLMPADVAAQQRQAQPDITAADYSVAQRAIDNGRHYSPQPGVALYVLVADGITTVLRLINTPDGPQLAALRRLTAAQAATDAELLQLAQLGQLALPLQAPQPPQPDQA